MIIIVYITNVPILFNFQSNEKILSTEEDGNFLRKHHLIKKNGQRTEMANTLTENVFHLSFSFGLLLLLLYRKYNLKYLS